MSKLRNVHTERMITKKRLVIVVSIFVCAYILLLSNLYTIQIKKHEYYLGLATQYHTRNVRIEPQRGKIYDANKHVLATDQTTFIACYPKLPLDQQEFIQQSALSTRKASKTHQCSEVESWDYAHINHWNNDAIILKTHLTRQYAQGNKLSHLIGYTSHASINPLSNEQASTHQSGVNGIESYYDDQLKGYPGKKVHTINASGTIQQTHTLSKSIAGEDIYTTIHSNLQKKAHYLLDGHSGTVIMLNPNTGAIIAAVSTPSFDPKNPIKSADYKNSNLLNRITQATYPPASTLKPIFSLLALEDQHISVQDKIHDPGYYLVGNKRFRDWKRQGHGEVDLNKAINESCDTYFYMLGHRLGIDTLVNYLSLFKFNQATQIDLPNEKNNLIPTAQYRRARSGGWYDGHTIITAIGQGDLAVTPISLARATMLLANKGYDHQLHINKSNQSIAKTPTLKVQDKNWEIIHTILSSVTQTGTAKKFAGSSYSVAGKTGSAQVKAIDKKADYYTLKQYEKDHSLFIGFSPVINPEVAIVTIIEHEPLAVKVSKSMLDYYWEVTQK
ncbi:hypothetical protein MMH89_02170 [Candidatus Comchoanobacter bicostacola]|uniref:beta-lactamase n=1 Tax=Candidatus Comchoanobacter bicostacola TaxID=2919598 RepID=A0ABY5DM26_9GAMM|nr:penicillin-binding transpeptidase domain-containing protein [Candidatus Comchoanobacter bicostacola]UTC24953.1 hypothetical protein MMH89_02170 [Candidatus Comchoanobacter bicostacola]